MAAHASTLSGRLGAGPAISLSFVLVAIACGFAAICYAELASMIPIAGSAYTYSYATLGEIFAWIIGWDLILEYAFSNMSVAVGFSAYLNDLLDNLFHFHLPTQLSQPIFEEGQRTGAWFNLTAFIVLLMLSYVLVRGVRESAQDQQHHGGDQNRRHPVVRLRRRARGEHRQLASVHAQRLFGRALGRRDRLFHLHRIRFGIHGGRRMRTAPARHAGRNLRDAGGLRAAVRLGGAGAHRHRALGHAR